ncbi:MAG: hypothetical protein HZB53_05635 [Chloroflexi bacterium]|nr:hypothetical protein [Chloroflexota bacterium]
MNNKQNDRRSLADLLRGYAPRPGPAFQARMTDAPWQKPARAPGWGLWPRLAVVAASLLLIAVAVTLATPEARASLSSWLGLGVSPSAVVTPPAVMPADLVSSAKLSEISQSAGWTAAAPGWVPEGYRFGQANYDTRNGLVYMSFLATRQLPGGDPKLTQTKALSLVQARQNTLIPLQVAPTTSVQDVTVNKQPAAYAVGAWKSEFVPKAGEPGGGHMESRWRGDLAVQNVFWQVGAVYVVLISDDAAVTRQDLLKVADSVR